MTNDLIQTTRIGRQKRVPYGLLGDIVFLGLAFDARGPVFVIGGVPDGGIRNETY